MDIASLHRQTEIKFPHDSPLLHLKDNPPRFAILAPKLRPKTDDRPADTFPLLTEDHSWLGIHNIYAIFDRSCVAQNIFYIEPADRSGEKPYVPISPLRGTRGVEGVFGHYDLYVGRKAVDLIRTHPQTKDARFNFGEYKETEKRV